MSFNEKIQPNKVNAPVLFIGVGGIGSKIIKGVADRSLKDDTGNIRFVVMDTDVNDLVNVDKGANIVAVQTSSTSTVKDYLNNDKDAKKRWFPENQMLDPKPVSEGAGQIRAISRLALNATIKQGNIRKLYKAIDDLFLKDGGGYKQAIRVVIASTAAGGTGSGIAMETGMLVRHYVKKNYPEAATMIRGFLVMPGVLDTVINTQSERDSLRCNGYATIKEINAFMMKGSGFFDTVPELRRYKNIHLSIPGSSGEDEQLSNLPFDFCFLMDRTDSNTGNMPDLQQYINFAAQTIYEQNIGPMRSKASSMEDNVLKLCISPENLGRCRFGGAGASAVVYPYEDIRDFIALNWARASVIGSSADDKLSDKERKELLNSSWLQYDIKFRQALKEYEENPNSGASEPKIEKEYVSAMNEGKDASSGNNFTAKLWKNYLTPKVCELSKSSSEGSEDGERLATLLEHIKVNSSTQSVALSYLSKMIQEVIDHRLKTGFPDFLSNLSVAELPTSSEMISHKDKYEALECIEDVCRNERVADIAKTFANGVFTSKSSVAQEGLGDFMLERFISINGKAMHPNAVRYMLYELQTVLRIAKNIFKNDIDITEFDRTVTSIKYGDEGKGGIDKFQVKSVKAIGKETNLSEMCNACDEAKYFRGTEYGDSCEKYLIGYYNTLKRFFVSVIGNSICDVAMPKVSALINAYQNFFDTFESKIPSIERKKEDIVTKLRFTEGDYVYYVLGKKAYLNRLTSLVHRPTDSGEEAATLYAKIFESLRNNSYIEARQNVNPFNYEAQEDIFDDVIIEYYKGRVEKTCEEINVKGILQAIKLEFDVKNSIELAETSEILRSKKAEEITSDNNLKKYISGIIDKCNNLASPGIKKKDHDEAREVAAIACSEDTSDGDGIRVNDFIPNAIKAGSVSKYELRFFRSVYNITPIQISKLCAPKYEDNDYSMFSDKDSAFENAGDYFKIYQQYMDKIGPDSKASAIITPHVDMRWNAISILPELDIAYQKRLMKKIHKAMIYGFVYGRIRLCPISDEDPNEKIYRYLDDDEYKMDLIVSNGTKCDVLFEVLDALYFDRFAVSVLCDYVLGVQEKMKNAGYKSYEESEFFKELSKLSHGKVVNNSDKKTEKVQMSLFEIVLLYCNSLPVQNKDVAEMRTMIEAIIEIIRNEMSLCGSNPDTINAKVAGVLVEQFNILVNNYNDYKDCFRVGIFSDEVVDTTKGVVLSYLKKNDLAKYRDKMAEFELG